MRWLYQIGISAYHFFIYLASFFNPKAKLWVEGRHDIFQKIKSQLGHNDSIIWFHCASLGEFEQGRPLIEKIKSQLPHYKIFLTFYSPSGYEIRKNYEYADYVFYLPKDSKSNAQQFLQLVKPQFVFFVKYEFWYFYLTALQQQKIPTYLISATFRKDQIFFKPYGIFFREMLLGFKHIFVQDDFSEKLLLENGIQKVSVAGDTRVDRVLEIQKKAKQFPIIENFKGTTDLLIGGSTWQRDEDILMQWMQQQNNFRWKMILAPHDISESHLQQIEIKLEVNHVRFSQANAINVTAAKVLIIDNIGMLSSIYQYGKIAFIGGGFGAGIHNTLEPIAFGLPVIFGTKYQKFAEAKFLVQSGGGFSVSNFSKFESVMANLNQAEFYQKSSNAAKDYVFKNQGATEKIFERIMNYEL